MAFNIFESAEKSAIPQKYKGNLRSTFSHSLNIWGALAIYENNPPNTNAWTNVDIMTRLFVNVVL